MCQIWFQNAFQEAGIGWPETSVTGERRAVDSTPYARAQAALRIAREMEREQDTKDALDELNALLLFRNDMGTLVRVYSFLSQIFD